MMSLFLNSNKIVLEDSVYIFDGNSLTNRSPETSYSTFLKQLAPFAGMAVNKWLNFGVGGQRTDQMIADFDTQIMSQFVAGKNNFLFCFESLNYIAYYGYSSRDALDLFWQYVDHAKTIGFKVGVATSADMYRTTTYDTPTTYREKIAELNRLIRLEWRSHCNFIYDLAAIPELQNALDSDYYLDPLHWNDAGKQLGAECLKQALLKYTGNKNLI